MSDVWRVLVTGPVTGIEDWLEAARSAGWEARALPLRRVVPIHAPELAASDSKLDWIALTSSNAIAALAAAAESRPALREIRLAAVGEATAERALGAGLNPVLVPAPGASHARGLATELLAETSEGDRILWPRGAGAGELTPNLGSTLRESGRIVDDPVVYRTEPIEVPIPAPDVDAVFFASPSAVRTWVAAAVQIRPAAIAIGWTTYDALLAAPDHFSTLLPLTEPSTAAFKLALESFFPSE